jgi:hypothetical protein
MIPADRVVPHGLGEAVTVIVPPVPPEGGGVKLAT